MNVFQTKYMDVIEEIRSVDGIYYGGSVAYFNVATALALFCKILKRKILRGGNRKHTYEVLHAFSDNLIADSLTSADEDGIIFSNLTNPEFPEKDKYIETVIIKQISYLTNMQSIKDYLSLLIQETNSSLKADLIYILSALNIARENFVSIIKYEISLIKEELLKATFQGEITKL